MKKKTKPGKRGFDERFDKGEIRVDFSSGVATSGLSKTMKLPPLEVPMWLVMEIERLAQFQANTKASVVRQLLVEAIESRKYRIAS